MSRLVLTRRIGESIHVSADIVVTLVSIRGRQAKISIEAPRHVKVLRDELVETAAKEPTIPSV